MPFAYQLASVASIAAFARTKRYRFFRASQLGMMLVLPFLLQWSLGGFGQSSAVALWALMAPLGALVFLDLRRAVPWFMAFVALVAISGLIDARLTEADVPGWIVIAFFVMNVLGVSTTVYLLLQYFMRARERILAELEEKHAAGPACRSSSARPANSPRNGPTAIWPPPTHGPVLNSPSPNGAAATRSNRRRQRLPARRSRQPAKSANGHAAKESPCPIVAGFAPTSGKHGATPSNRDHPKRHKITRTTRFAPLLSRPQDRRRDARDDAVAFRPQPRGDGPVP
jgi:hypothetical protein